MKILFIGDSITKGKTGANFVKHIRLKHPFYTVNNYGINGDTFSNICRRLLTILENDNSYDCIVLQGGYNDIFLPYFTKKGKLFQFALKQQLKKGLVPLKTADEFENELKRTIQKVKLVFEGKLILATLGCINEDLQFELNTKRAAYNYAIKKLAKEQEVYLADCGLQFDKFLSAKRQTNYFLENFWALVLTDPIILLFEKGIAMLSRKRKLHLTIDGVHLNTRGAKIFKACIMEQLQTPKRSG